MPVVGDVESSPAGAVTVSDLVEETRRHLGGRSGELNRLASNVTVGHTSLTFEFDLGGIVEGSMIAVNDEVFYVWSVNQSTRTIIVQRAMMGSTVATHSTGDIVEVAPRFSRFAIKRALQQEIRSWSPRLFTVTAVDVAFLANRRTADLAGVTSIQFPIDCRLQPDTGNIAENWKRIRVDVIPSLPTSEFASGYALQLATAFTSAQTVRFVYAKPITADTFNDWTQPVTDLGLLASMLDIPPVGAAWRLLSMREAVRTDTRAQGEPRMAEEVPPGHAASAASGFKRLRDIRIQEEIEALRTLYPITGW